MVAENLNENLYGWIMFERGTVDFVLRAIDFYLSLLIDYLLPVIEQAERIADVS